ncbi:MAG: phosphatase PAP2 family protein [Clostridiales bacterium]|nr:phosphatase PAP2 family protein [Clostridiales bacterium]MDY2909313.1 phosphatase PAP2 family protein [Oscillospiraceae bacterium]
MKTEIRAVETKKRLPLPAYSILPLVVTVICHTLCYSGSKLINVHFPHHEIHSALDAAIPLVPEWVIVYVGTFFFWMVGLVMIMREDKALCYELFSALVISYAVCFVIFLVYPTTMERPELSGSGYASQLLGVLWQLDTPTNLFPSMHCLLSWLVFRASLRCKKTNTFFKVLSFVASVLIFASVVLVKQHVFVDIIGGVFFAELVLFLAKKLHGENFFYNIEKKLLKKSL